MSPNSSPNLRLEHSKCPFRQPWAAQSGVLVGLGVCRLCISHQTPTSPFFSPKKPSFNFQQLLLTFTFYFKGSKARLSLPSLFNCQCGPTVSFRQPPGLSLPGRRVQVILLFWQSSAVMHKGFAQFVKKLSCSEMCAMCRFLLLAEVRGLPIFMSYSVEVWA